MTSETNDSRQLARVVTIGEVSPIENADAIERIKVGGWTVVSQKGNFREGDQAIYFEIDSLLPLYDGTPEGEKRFEFLRQHGARMLADGTSVHRLKTKRLRGVYSQGLLLPAELFNDEIKALEGTNLPLDSLLGIVKYEPALPTNMETVGGFPRHIRKTDSERVQNLAGDWDEILTHRDEFVATEKVDGTSLTVWKDEDGTPHAASRNWEVEDAEGSLYWRMAREAGLIDFLDAGEAIQAEIFGDNVQGNPLGLPDTRVAVFTWFDENGKHVPRNSGGEGWELLAKNDKCILAPIYEGLKLPDTIDEAVAQVDGIKSLISPKRLAEGVVWHRLSYGGLDVLGGRATFKAISNKYLVKHDG